jgi:hypothetical protein
VAHPDPITTTAQAQRVASSANQIQSFRSRPDLRPPAVTVTTSSPAAAAGDVFLAPYLGPGQPGPMIIDGSGHLVWFKSLPPHVSATNLSVQQYQDQPMLTWWQGDISVHGYGLGEDVIANNRYETVAVVRAGNGVAADLHEFQLTGQNTALITAFKPIYCNLGAEGGRSASAVNDALWQEIDVRTGLVRYEWDSLDHVGLPESYQPASNASTSWPFDYFHINSLNVDQDGTILVSARNTWAAYDVSPMTGQILWRLGGKRSSFTMGPGTTTAWQHDVRELGNGVFSIFDNGASPKVHSQSRGVLVHVDTQQMTATLAGQVTHPSPLLAPSQGNLEQLQNGDWFAGWGQVPYVSEFNSSGQLVFDAHLPAADESYRAFRFPWNATPVHPPSLKLVNGAGGATVGYASWNGATAVASWRLLAGSSPAQLAPVATQPSSGFETAINAPAKAAYFAVQALDANGATLGTSGTQRA